jgi:hypothetical protein
VVNAKFIVSSVSEWGHGIQVKMSPDYANGRNKEWSQATPAGSIEMFVTNPPAVAFFQPGKQLTVTFVEEAS